MQSATVAQFILKATASKSPLPWLKEIQKCSYIPPDTGLRLVRTFSAIKSFIRNLCQSLFISTFKEAGFPAPHDKEYSNAVTKYMQ